jgi:hypothetical protein
MKFLGAGLFALGILLAVRVMFFGVRLPATGQQFKLRASRLAIAAMLVAAGAFAYARGRLGNEVTVGWLALVVMVAALAGGGAWWVVRASAQTDTVDPDDDPKFRYQGFVGRVVSSIHGQNGTGRIAFEVDGQRVELSARWLPDQLDVGGHGAVDSEVVIEHIDGDVAYVEPWAVVEGRL